MNLFEIAVRFSNKLTEFKKMKSNLGLLPILILTIISFVFSRRYQEDPGNIERRMKYLNEFSNTTYRQINYTYTPETGMICTMNKDINSYERMYKIPSEYIISFCKQNNKY